MIRVFIDKLLHRGERLLGLPEPGQADALAKQSIRPQLVLSVLGEKAVEGLERRVQLTVIHFQLSQALVYVPPYSEGFLTIQI